MRGRRVMIEKEFARLKREHALASLQRARVGACLSCP
jgi:hypothetical protein